MTYQEVILSISNSLLQRFDEVYHSAEVFTNDAGKKIPVLSNDYEVNLSPTDQRETIYIRRNGDDEVLEELKLGSCGKAYKMRSQLRIVFFKDKAELHNKILSDLMQSVLITGTKLNKVIRDKFKLLKDESSGDYNFGATTAYFAIDIYALWILNPDTCEQDFCTELENPLYKIDSP
jgi:hypothetical protein